MTNIKLINRPTIDLYDLLVQLYADQEGLVVEVKDEKKIQSEKRQSA